MTKEPLGPDDDPQSILSYKQSPRAARKPSSDQGTPKSQKKVRIHDEIEIQETQNYIQDLSDDETIKSGDDNLDSEEEAEAVQASADEKSEPKGILKKSQKLLENIKPSTSKFDSGSLKKKIKNPLQKIKKMADQQFKRVKASRSSIKKVPVSKDEIVLNEELKILKLKESPKSEHREYTAYVVQHQDSEDSVEIMKLDESPFESRKRRENEAHIVTPDEIIELPASKQSDDRREQRESTVESHEISISGSSSPSKTDEPPIAPKKREHQYEDIEDYISKITEDGESVERVHPQQDTRLQRQHQIGSIIDPTFDEFSRDFSKNIRLSLTAQDDKLRQELAKKIPKIEQLEKQISDEERVEEVVKQMHLLAPISSIDSTSSDEASRAHLSILAEESESESNKKKSFEDSSFDRDISSFERDIESLKNDISDSMTLIEDELKNLESKSPTNFAKDQPEAADMISEAQANENDSSTSGTRTLGTQELTTSEGTADESEQLKEDVIVKTEAETSSPIKITPRWSKMRFVLKYFKSFFFLQSNTL